MRICGVDYSGTDMIPVVLQAEGGQWSFLDLAPRKFTLNDLWDTDDVRLFAKAITAFLDEHRIDRVVVKKRVTSGRYGGGAASFRMGAILQVSTERPVLFMSPQAIRSALKDVMLQYPEKMLQYQRSAFDVAQSYVRRQMD